MFTFQQTYIHRNGTVYRDVYVITDDGKDAVITHSMAEAVELTRGINK